MTLTSPARFAVTLTWWVVRVYAAVVLALVLLADLVGAVALPPVGALACAFVLYLITRTW